MDDMREETERFEERLYLKRRDVFRREISTVIDSSIRRIAESRELVAKVDKQLASWQRPEAIGGRRNGPTGRATVSIAAILEFGSNGRARALR